MVSALPGFDRRGPRDRPALHARPGVRVEPEDLLGVRGRIVGFERDLVAGLRSGLGLDQRPRCIAEDRRTRLRLPAGAPGRENVIAVAAREFSSVGTDRFARGTQGGAMHLIGSPTRIAGPERFEIRANFRRVLPRYDVAGIHPWRCVCAHGLWFRLKWVVHELRRPIKR